MRKMFNLIGLGGRAALTALFAFTAACLLSVSSAKAAVIADWTNGTLDPYGADVSLATPGSFTEPITSAKTINFLVQLNSGWRASGVNDQFTFTVTGLTGSHSVTINGVPYGNVANRTVIANLDDIASGGSASFSIAVTGSVEKSGSITFSDVQLNAMTVVPEPITYAMAVFGLVFVGGSAGRFYVSRRRLAMAS